MVKSYLRFVPVDVIGVAVSPNANIASDNESLCYVPTLEHVTIWNLKKSVEIGRLTATATFEDRCEVVRVALSIPADLVAGGFSNGSITVWNKTAKTEKASLVGHKSAISALAFDQKGTLLVSGGHDTDIVVWDMVSETGLFRLKGHRDQVTDVHFLENSRRIVSSSKDKLVKIWDMDTQHCVYTISEHTEEVWGCACAYQGALLATTTAGPEIKLWHYINNNQRTEEISIPEVLFRFALTRNTSARPISIRFYYRQMTSESLHEHTDGVLNLNEKQGEAILVCVNTDKTVEMWLVRSLEAAKKKRQRRLQRKREKQSKKSDVEAEAEESEDSALTARDIFHALPVLRCDHKIAAVSLLRPSGRGKAIESVVARTVVAFQNNTCQIFNLETSDGKETFEFKDISLIDTVGHPSDVRSICLSKDDAYLASTCSSELRIWNVDTRQCARTIKSGYGLNALFVPGNRHVVVGTKEGSLELYDVSSGTQLEVITKAHNGAIWGSALHPSGNTFVTASADKDVKFWSFQLVLDESYSRETKRLTLLHERTLSMTDDVLAVHITSDGKFLAVALLDSTVKVFYEDSLKFFLSFYGHKLPVLAIDSSSDGDLMVTGSGDKNVKIWGLDFGDCHRSLFAHDGAVTAVKFVPLTHHFFSAGKDGVIKYWDADKFECILSMKAHFSDIWGLAISRSGTFLVSCSKDRSLRFFEQTEDQVFLEEEREKTMEKRFLEGQDEVEGAVDNQVKVVGVESGIAAKTTLNTLSSSERLIEALEIADNEIQLQKSHPSSDGRTIIQSPLLAALKRTPHQHVLTSLCEIAVPELESTLMFLPFSHVLRLFEYLADFMAQGQMLEVCMRCTHILLRTHHSQLINNKSMATTLSHLHTSMRYHATELKSVMGFNLAGLTHLRRELETSSSTLFDEAVKNLQEKQTRKRRRRN
eukprot:c10125_g1_i9.p1 GENE.c10125_g1_i9~~c10125_g1_i9.p1  ORF type:complete len:932 (-),score=269.10 c10125_g1_i9:1249-4044(-)